jgi:molecular chaperone IbpA
LLRFREPLRALLKTAVFSPFHARRVPLWPGDGASGPLNAAGRSALLLTNGGQDMRSAFDFSPFRRSTVGFDRLFDMLENSSVGQSQENYPPFDLIKLGDNEYRIELAVAGFKPDELDITAQQNVLIVSGRKKDETEQKGSDYIYRGIATRSFERRFALADHIQVRGADMHDGLLSIELVREIPEAMKPKKINIGASAPKHDQIGGDTPASQQTVNAEAEHA